MAGLAVLMDGGVGGVAGVDPDGLVDGISEKSTPMEDSTVSEEVPLWELDLRDSNDPACYELLIMIDRQTRNDWLRIIVKRHSSRDLNIYFLFGFLFHLFISK